MQTHLAESARILCTLLLSSLAVGALAQSSATEDAAPPARYVWTGTQVRDGGRAGEPPETAVAGTKTGMTRTNPRRRTEELLAELARVELSIEVDRRFDEARARLDELWVRAARKTDYEGRLEVLERVALARSHLAELQGRGETALAELQQLLPDERIRAALGASFELEPADEALVASERTALGAPALAAARERLQRGGGMRPPQPPEGDQGLEPAVRAALSSLDTRLVTDLGMRAAPTLERIALEGREHINMPSGVDPLNLLYQIDRLRALRFFQSQIDAGGGVWRWRIAQVLVEHGVLKGPEWIEPQEEQARKQLNRPAREELMPLVERLVADETARSVALKLIADAARYNGITPSLQAKLIEYLQAADVQLREQAFEAVRNSSYAPTVRPVLEAGLKSEATSLRRRCAMTLADLGPSPALAALADDPDAEVRINVANSYADHELDATGPAVLERLSRDPDRGVRMTVARAATKVRPPLAEELYVRLANDADRGVVTVLASNSDASTPAMAQILEALAKDEATTRTYDDLLEKLRNVQPKDRPDDWFVPYVPGLARRIEIGQKSDAWLTNPFRGNLWAAMRSESGMRAISAAVAARNEPLLWSAWFQSLPFVSGSGTVYPGLRAVDPRHVEIGLRAWLAGSWGGRADFVRDARFTVRSARPGVTPIGWRPATEQLPGWRAVALDPSVSVVARGVAASIAVAASDDELENALIALFADPEWSRGEGNVDLDPRQWVPRYLMIAFDPARRERFLLRAFQDPAVSDAVLAQIVRGTEPREIAPSVALAALERWSTSFDTQKVDLELLFYRLPEGADGNVPRVTAVLTTAVRTRNTAEHAIAYMGRSRQPAYIPILAACLDASGLSDRELIQTAAAAALTSYMTEQAAEELLHGVTLAVGPKARDACLAGVEQVRKYLEEKRRWAARSSDAERRTTSIRELVALLSDGDATTRAQAARGLATLNAVDEVPRLVALLKDKSPEVRGAAQQALDALSAKSKQE